VRWLVPHLVMHRARYSRQLGSIYDEGSIFITPINNSLVSIHDYLPDKWYFRIILRTC